MSLLRRPRILFLTMTTLWPNPAFAQCHIFSVWHYPKPQKCFTALAPLPERTRSFRQEAGFSRKEAGFLPHETFHERIEAAWPSLEFEPCPDGDEHLRGIAKLRALMDAR